MDRLKNILVPVDGSDMARSAIPFAQALAGADGDILLLQVVSPSDPIRDNLGVALVSEEMAGQWHVEEVQKEIDEFAETLRLSMHSGITVKTVVIVGDPATEILAAAQREQIGMIVMTSHARGALGRVAFGSVADRVARTAKIPVVIVRPTDDLGPVGKPAKLRRIILPLDGSALANSAIPFVNDIAVRLGIPVSLVYVMDTVSPYVAAGAMPIPQSALDTWWNEARDMLEPAAKIFDEAGVSTKIDILQGAPFPAIANFATAGDLIVMTSHGRTGFTRWLLGSVAEKLVRGAPVPVCIVPARQPELVNPSTTQPSAV
jgi:nucleotide-binding universal stress UspA family protein